MDVRSLGYCAIETTDRPGWRSYGPGGLGFAEIACDDPGAGQFRVDDRPFSLRAAPVRGIYFFHSDSPRHHSLCIFEGPSPVGLHHFMVEVPDIDEVGLCLDRAEARGIEVVKTLGRHGNDRMLSIYLRAPGGFIVEY